MPVLCYLLGLAGAGVFVVYLLARGCGVWPWPPLVSGPPWPINLSWLLLFALQHSGMARDGVKQAWTRVIPGALERSFYVGLSGLLLLALPLLWQPLPGEPVWRLPVGVVVVPVLAGLAQAWLLTWHDRASFFGLRQAIPEEKLLVAGPYRYVRHPLMLCLLVLLWAQPILWPDLALLVGGLTVYVLVGVRLEERDLLRRFGVSYLAYRRRVPMLIPWRPPLGDSEVTG